MDGSDRLCRALYGDSYSPSKMLGGSQAPMLHDATDKIERLRAALQRIANDSYTREDERLTNPTPTMIWQAVARQALE